MLVYMTMVGLCNESAVALSQKISGLPTRYCHLTLRHSGTVVFDYDNDGLQDIYAVNGWITGKQDDDL